MDAGFTDCFPAGFLIPEIPPRSRLYPLEPRGLGTPRTESLTSYIARLAAAHRVTVGSLFALELAPAINKPYLLLKARKNESALSTSFYSATPSLVGSGNTAEDWVKVLEKLTSVDGLRFLTMLTWRNVTANGHTSRSTKAWCPVCFQEQHDSGVIVYEHLLWMQKFVAVCPYHRRPLESRCPHCGKQLRPLSDRARPGYCSRCWAWLGASGNADVIVASDDAQIEYQVWTAEQIGEMIAQAPSLTTPPDKGTLKRAISNCIEECAGGFIPGFARYFGINVMTVRSWLTNNNSPKYDLLLRVCRRLDVHLREFITGQDLFVGVERKSRLLQIRTEAGRTIIRRKVDDVRKKLLEILQEDPPLSMNEVVERLGYKNSSGLVQYHPELCKQITARHRAYRKRQKKHKTKCQKRQKTGKVHDDEVVKSALEKALAEEAPPSLTSIANSLGYKCSKTLLKRFPEQCREILNRRAAKKAEQDDNIRKKLQAALLEDPPPSMYTVARRLGYDNSTTLSQRFPVFHKRLVTRFKKYQEDRSKKIRSILESALTEEVPPSLREIAKRVKHTPSYLGQLFPDLCKVITERRSQFQRERTLRRKREDKENVRSLALEMYSNGVYPSALKIRKSILNPLCLNAMELCSTLREVRNELGLMGRRTVVRA